MLARSFRSAATLFVLPFAVAFYSKFFVWAWCLTFEVMHRVYGI